MLIIGLLDSREMYHLKMFQNSRNNQKENTFKQIVSLNCQSGVQPGCTVSIMFSQYNLYSFIPDFLFTHA